MFVVKLPVAVLRFPKFAVSATDKLPVKLALVALTLPTANVPEIFKLLTFAVLATSVFVIVTFAAVNNKFAVILFETMFPLAVTLVIPATLYGKSIIIVEVEFSRMARPPAFPKLLLLRPTASVLLVTLTHAILAETTTFPVGLFTVIPAPGVLLTL